MARHTSRIVKTVVLALALACAACATGGARKSPGPEAAYELSELQALVRPFVDYGYARGIAAAIVRDDGVQTYGYGKATEDGAAPDAHTLFEIGSVTKLFTALTLATMVADGELALDEPVAELLPAGVHVPEYDGKKITLLSLATHSSGLPRMPSNFQPGDPWNPYLDYGAEKLYAFLSGYALARDPGSQYEYSNLGMGLLGDALSVRAKKPYGELVRERVLAPLRLNHTYVGAIPAIERLADGQDILGAPARPWDFDVLAPAGAIRSDAADTAAFVRASLKPPRRLRAAVLLTQAEHGTTPDGTIGLGWHIGFKDLPRARVHSGQTGGFHSFIALDGEKPLGVVVLANTATDAVDLLGYALLQMLRGEPHDVALPRPVAVSAEALDRCTGRFAVEPGVELTITRQSRVLIAQFTGQMKIPAYPSSETTFHLVAQSLQLDFEMGPDGRATRVVLRTPSETASADRVE